MSSCRGRDHERRCPLLLEQEAFASKMDKRQVSANSAVPRVLLCGMQDGTI
jgi:hypothetical protein